MIEATVAVMASKHGASRLCPPGRAFREERSGPRKAGAARDHPGRPIGRAGSPTHALNVPGHQVASDPENALCGPPMRRRWPRPRSSRPAPLNAGSDRLSVSYLQALCKGNTYAMCRGPGRIQQEIAALIGANPEDAWTTGELCGLIYYGQRSHAPTPEKKHRVAVTRAFRQMELPPLWRTVRLNRSGAEHCLYNAGSLESTIRKYHLAGWPLDSRYLIERVPKDVAAARRYDEASPVEKTSTLAGCSSVPWRSRGLGLARERSRSWPRKLAKFAPTQSRAAGHPEPRGEPEPGR